MTDNTPTPAVDNDITKFRRDLVAQAAAHQRLADKYILSAYGAKPVDENVNEAFLGNSMAANYAYTLAAVLKMVERRVSPEVAEVIALDAHLIMVDGDDTDLNDDVTPDDVNLGSGEQR